VQGSLLVFCLCCGRLWQVALAQCKALYDEQKQLCELQNKNKSIMFSLKQTVPREQDVFCSDNHAIEFSMQLRNKKNKVIQVSYSSTETWYVLSAPLRHEKSCFFSVPVVCYWNTCNGYTSQRLLLVARNFILIEMPLLKCHFKVF